MSQPQARYTIRGQPDRVFTFSRYKYDMPNTRFLAKDESGNEIRFKPEDAIILDEDNHLPDVIGAFATIRKHMFAHAAEEKDPVAHMFDDEILDSSLGIREEKAFLLAALPVRSVAVPDAMRLDGEIQMALAKGPERGRLISMMKHNEAVCEGALIELAAANPGLLGEIPLAKRTGRVCAAALEKDPLVAFPKIPEVHRTDEMETAYLQAKRVAEEAAKIAKKAAAAAKKAGKIAKK